MSKHILIISQYFYPEQFRINDIAAEWKKRGYRVTVLTGIPNYPQGKFYPGYHWFRNRRETWNGVEVIRIPLIARGKSSVCLALNYFSFVISGFFWQCFTKIKADYVFTFEVSPMTQALIGVWYAGRRKIPNYLYVQDLWPENVESVTGIHSKFVIGPISRMVNYIYRHCDRIFATSPSFVKEIQKRTPGEEEKVLYWPQYAEEFYQPSQTKSDLIARDGSFHITFTGNIGTAQGLEILPAAARILNDRGIPVRFHIVGDGRNRENLQNEIRSAGVEANFHFTGWQPAQSVPAILAASDAAFLSFANDPLFSMTIPAKLQSYMACGCPIIAAAEGETQRVIEEARCGIVTRIGDPESLASGIQQMIGLDSRQRKTLGENALTYCRGHFNKDLLISALIQQHLN